MSIAEHAHWVAYNRIVHILYFAQEHEKHDLWGLSDRAEKLTSTFLGELDDIQWQKKSLHSNLNKHLKSGIISFGPFLTHIEWT